MQPEARPRQRAALVASVWWRRPTLQPNCVACSPHTDVCVVLCNDPAFARLHNMDLANFVQVANLAARQATHQCVECIRHRAVGKVCSSFRRVADRESCDPGTCRFACTHPLRTRYGQQRGVPDQSFTLLFACRFVRQSATERQDTHQQRRAQRWRQPVVSSSQARGDK